MGKEDCLHLNVWTPATSTADSRLPVMVFIHGGSNVQGAASTHLLGMDLYDGKNLSETGDVVVVSLNYRLGNLGFCRFGRSRRKRPKYSSNFGILDQIAALNG